MSYNQPNCLWPPSLRICLCNSMHPSHSSLSFALIIISRIGLSFISTTLPCHCSVTIADYHQNPSPTETPEFIRGEEVWASINIVEALFNSLRFVDLAEEWTLVPSNFLRSKYPEVLLPKIKHFWFLYNTLSYRWKPFMNRGAVFFM